MHVKLMWNMKAIFHLKQSELPWKLGDISLMWYNAVFSPLTNDSTVLKESQTNYTSIAKL